jgi:DNA polymerase III epsilon subunit-like protein
MKTATPIDEARLQILEILRGKLVVAHHIKHDLDALSITLPPEAIRDTALCVPLRRMANLTPHEMPSLKKLSLLVLGEEIQQGAHCSYVDAWTAMSLYRCVEEEWEGRK